MGSHSFVFLSLAIVEYLFIFYKNAFLVSLTLFISSSQLMCGSIK